VVEKHDFRAIQRKIPQISDFAKKRDLNPLPHGDIADDIAKMFANFFLQKSDFCKKLIFAKTSFFAKNLNVLQKDQFISIFFVKNADFFAKMPIFAKLPIFAKTLIFKYFLQKIRFLQKH
jgi:hypothetical protein